jgi:hypothetical protein
VTQCGKGKFANAVLARSPITKEERSGTDISIVVQGMHYGYRHIMTSGIDRWGNLRVKAMNMRDIRSGLLYQAVNFVVGRPRPGILITKPQSFQYCGFIYVIIKSLIPNDLNPVILEKLRLIPSNIVFPAWSRCTIEIMNKEDLHFDTVLGLAITLLNVSYFKGNCRQSIFTTAPNSAPRMNSR